MYRAVSTPDLLISAKRLHAKSRSRLTSASNSRRVSVRSEMDIVDQAKKGPSGNSLKRWSFSRKRRALTPEMIRSRPISAVSKISFRSEPEPRTTKAALLRQQATNEHKKAMNGSVEQGYMGKKRLQKPRPKAMEGSQETTNQGGLEHEESLVGDHSRKSAPSKMRHHSAPSKGPFDKDALKLDFRGLYDDGEEETASVDITRGQGTPDTDHEWDQKSPEPGIEKGNERRAFSETNYVPGGSRQDSHPQIDTQGIKGNHGSNAMGVAYPQPRPGDDVVDQQVSSRNQKVPTDNQRVEKHPVSKEHRTIASYRKNKTKSNGNSEVSDGGRNGKMTSDEPAVAASKLRSSQVPENQEGSLKRDVTADSFPNDAMDHGSTKRNDREADKKSLNGDYVDDHDQTRVDAGDTVNSPEGNAIPVEKPTAVRSFSKEPILNEEHQKRNPRESDSKTIMRHDKGVNMPSTRRDEKPLQSSGHAEKSRSQENTRGIGNDTGQAAGSDRKDNDDVRGKGYGKLMKTGTTDYVKTQLEAKPLTPIGRSLAMNDVSSSDRPVKSASSGSRAVETAVEGTGSEEQPGIEKDIPPGTGQIYASNSSGRNLSRHRSSDHAKGIKFVPAPGIDWNKRGQSNEESAVDEGAHEIRRKAGNGRGTERQEKLEEKNGIFQNETSPSSRIVQHPTGDYSVSADRVKTSEISADRITTPQLSANRVTTPEISAGSVTNSVLPGQSKIGLHDSPISPMKSKADGINYEQVHRSPHVTTKSRDGSAVTSTNNTPVGDGLVRSSSHPEGLLTPENIENIRQYLEDPTAGNLDNAKKARKTEDHAKQEPEPVDPLHSLAAVFNKMSDEKHQLTELCTQLFQQMQFAAQKLVEIESRQEQSLVSLLPKQHQPMTRKTTSEKESAEDREEPTETRKEPAETRKEIAAARNKTEGQNRSCERCEQLEKYYTQKINQLRRDHQEEMRALKAMQQTNQLPVHDQAVYHHSSNLNTSSTHQTETATLNQNNSHGPRQLQSTDSRVQKAKDPEPARTSRFTGDEDNVDQQAPDLKEENETLKASWESSTAVRRSDQAGEAL